MYDIQPYCHSPAQLNVILSALAHMQLEDILDSPR